MTKKIRRSDIRLSSVLVPISQVIPATLIPEHEIYLKLVAAVPDWLLPVSIGFALASYLWDPFQQDSRLRQLWHFVTDRYQTECVGVSENSHTGEVHFQILLSFRRSIKGVELDFYEDDMLVHTIIIGNVKRGQRQWALIAKADDNRRLSYGQDGEGRSMRLPPSILRMKSMLQNTEIELNGQSTEYETDGSKLLIFPRIIEK